MNTQNGVPYTSRSLEIALRELVGKLLRQRRKRSIENVQSDGITTSLKLTGGDGSLTAISVTPSFVGLGVALPYLNKGMDMSPEQEFDRLIAGLSNRLYLTIVPRSEEFKREWIDHVTEHAYSIRKKCGIEKALEYLRA